jgi:hypothetical protein
MRASFAGFIGVLALAAPATWAQSYEFGGLGGGSFHFANKDIQGLRRSAEAGFKSGYSAGVIVGQNMYNYVGGEVRYTYQRHNLELEGNGQSASFSGDSHAIHYDFLLHATSRDAAVRPYIAFGAGVKIFRGTGREAALQPLGDVAILTKTNETLAMASFGGGVKIALGKRAWIRVDVHDYLSPFPKEVITPVPPGTVSGWLNNIVPTVGIGLRF